MSIVAAIVAELALKFPGADVSSVAPCSPHTRG